MGVGLCDKSARYGLRTVDPEFPFVKTFLMEEGGRVGAWRSSMGEPSTRRRRGGPRPWELKHLSTKGTKSNENQAVGATEPWRACRAIGPGTTGMGAWNREEGRTPVHAAGPSKEVRWLTWKAARRTKDRLRKLQRPMTDSERVLCGNERNWTVNTVNACPGQSRACHGVLMV